MRELYTYRKGLEKISNLIFKKQPFPSVLHPHDTKVDVSVNEVEVYQTTLDLGLNKATFAKFY